MNDFILAVFCIGISVVITTCTANTVWKFEAVDHGKAEFYLDNDHQRQWRWLPK